MNKYNLILVVTLFIMTTQLAFSQIDYNVKEKLEIDTTLEPIVEEFIRDARDRGYYMRSYIIRRIDFIGYYKEEHNGNLGIVSNDYRRIYINKSISNDYNKKRETIYHELGHALTKSEVHVCRGCDEIMSQYHIDKVDSNWDLKVDNYFKWLSENVK